MNDLKQQVAEIGALLGLMCKHSCEECTMIAYGSSNIRQVVLERGTILENMESVLQLKDVGLVLLI